MSTIRGEVQASTQAEINAAKQAYKDALTSATSAELTQAATALKDAEVQTGLAKALTVEERAALEAAVAPKTGPSSTLEFKHQLKADKVTDTAELNRQVEGQVARMNEIIEKEGMAGLKQRIRNYNKKLEQEGRAHVRTLDDPGEGLAWLHEPDMRTGGGPKDVFRTGDKRVNSIIGGQANRLAEDILNMPDTTVRIEIKLTIIPSK